MIKTEMYVAEDGRVFRTEEECFRYEEYEMMINPKTGNPVRIVPIGESLV